MDGEDGLKDIDRQFIEGKIQVAKGAHEKMLSFTNDQEDIN